MATPIWSFFSSTLFKPSFLELKVRIRQTDGHDINVANVNGRNKAQAKPPLIVKNY